MWIAHEMNRRNSWLQRLIAWVDGFAIARAIVGFFTVVFLAAIYMLSSFFGSEGGQETIRTVAIIAVGIVCAFLGLVAIGIVATPVWEFILGYIFGAGEVEMYDKKKKGGGDVDDGKTTKKKGLGDNKNVSGAP